MPRISAIIITKNEEEMLPRCLESLRWADEIIVLDSGSTDRTQEIARSFGAKVFEEPWKGYTLQKNSALEKADGDWIISLDADEEFSGEAQAEIRTLVARDDPAIDAYALRRKVFYLKKWITHGDWYPDYVVRLWRRKAGKFQGGRVHESVRVQGLTQRVDSEILHYTYRDLKDQQARMEKYAKLWAQDQHERGRPCGWSDLWLRPPLRFLRAIILKSGWMDGTHGFLIAWMCSKEVAMKYRNLRELYRLDSRH